MLLHSKRDETINSPIIYSPSGQLLHRFKITQWILHNYRIVIVLKVQSNMVPVCLMIIPLRQHYATHVSSHCIHCSAARNGGSFVPLVYHLLALLYKLMHAYSEG